MSQLTFKPIFERTLKEQGELLAPVIEQVKAANLKKGSYMSKVHIRKLTKGRKSLILDFSPYSKTLPNIT